MRRIALVLVLIGCHKTASDHAATRGATVIEWNAAKSTRAAFKTATFENRATHTDTIKVQANLEQMTLKLTYETAIAKYTEDGQSMAIGALTSLVVTVEDGKGFAVSKGACDGPNYQLTEPGTPPGFTILECYFHAAKPNNECAVTFQLKGDGSVLE